MNPKEKDKKLFDKIRELQRKREGLFKEMKLYDYEIERLSGGMKR